MWLWQDRVPALHRAGEAPAWISPRNPALPPSCAAFLAVPLRPYVTVSEQERSLQVAVRIQQCLLSSLMLSGRICSSLFSAGQAGRALWHMLLLWDLRAHGSQGWEGGVIRNTILPQRSAFAFKETCVCSAFRWLPQ